VYLTKFIFNFTLLFYCTLTEAVIKMSKDRQTTSLLQYLGLYVVSK